MTRDLVIPQADPTPLLGVLFFDVVDEEGRAVMLRLQLGLFTFSCKLLEIHGVTRG